VLIDRLRDLLGLSLLSSLEVFLVLAGVTLPLVFGKLAALLTLPLFLTNIAAIYLAFSSLPPPPNPFIISISYCVLVVCTALLVCSSSSESTM
jgi:hypothetical protein